MTRRISSFGRHGFFPESWLLVGRLLYYIRALWRRWRLIPWMTRLLGYQFSRSRDQIEIDITYACNLACFNCNRSVTLAREDNHIGLNEIRRFVDDSIRNQKRWKRIRILGGEPTLHPEITQIIDELLRYRSWNQGTHIDLVTNGHGDKVENVLKGIPKSIWVENSRKSSQRIQPGFGPFNLAPVDDPSFKDVDYGHGCFVMEQCGMGLTPSGYYPCAVAGGIDRILGSSLGRKYLPPDSDEMREEVRKLCQYCGRFRDGHFVPFNLRPLLKEELVSPTWKALYQQWHERRNARRTSAIRGTP